MRSLGFLLAGVGLCALSLVAVVLSDGNPLLAVAPAIVFGLAYAVWRLPLRWPLFVIAFLALTMENPADAPAQGLWKSPLYTAGALLLAHLNVTLHHRALIFSGLDVVLVYLFAVLLWRVYSRSPIDKPGRIAGARPMRLAVVVALGGMTWMWVYGMVRGGADVASSLWQVQRVVYLPLVFFAFDYALRPKDAWSLAKVLIGAACLKAVVAIYVRHTIAPPPGQAELEYATTHADSMLFAGAACAVVIMLLAGRSRGRVLLAVVTLPLLVAGMVANNRRMVWVELIVGLAVVFWLSPPTRAKRLVQRALLLASPLLLVYFVLGWGSEAAIFRPVHVLRTVVDSSADMSAKWRDWENYDLFYTVRASPLLGEGYGHGYIEIVKLPDISNVYALYRFIPHNSIMGLWAYGGIVGFTALWAMFFVGMFFGARACLHAELRDDRVAALASVAMIVVYLVHCYGDMGLGTWTSVFTVAPALAVSSQLAVRTHAWVPAEAPAPLPDIRVVPSEGLVPAPQGAEGAVS